MKGLLLILVLLTSGTQQYPGDWYTKNYYENGNMKEEGWLLKKEKTAYWIFYYSNGTIKEKGNYKLNAKDGYWKTYFSNGQLKSAGAFVNGKQNGWWEHFYENGKPKYQAFYIGRQKNDWYKSFDLKGNLTTIGKYSKSKKDYYWKYYEDGKLVKKEEWDDGTLLWKTTHEYNEIDAGVFDYYKNGTLVITGTFEINHGVIFYYKQNGDKLFEQKLE